MNKKRQLKQNLYLALALLLLAACGTKQEEAANLPVGPTTYCQSLPAFVQEIGFVQPLLSTSFPDYTGAALGDLDSEGNLVNIYQHPTWDDAGHLGPITRDGSGNLYVSPVPQVSLEQNPPEDQNKIFKIDSISGEMVEFIDLPGARPTAANPFGTIGLTYDCDTNSLYASTLAGSTAGEENGRIYRIDLTTRKVAAQLDNVDAIGLGTFNGFNGKRLYYGLARTPDVYSIALDSQGNFLGEPRHEFSLAALEGGGQEMARRISFTQDSMMQITAIEFTYSLHTAIAEQQTHYKLRYLPGDSWGVVENGR